MASFEFHHKGARFIAEDEGRGRAVIFLHGFLESRRMWRDLLPSLPKGIRKISLDLPGHGDSENLSYVHSMEDMADLVRSLMKHLYLRKAVLCGHSMGGYVALAFAEFYPDYLKGLILINSNSRADSEERKHNRSRAIAVVKKNPKAYIRQAIPMLFSPSSKDRLNDAISRASEEALRTSAQGVVAALEGMKIRPDREPILAFAPYPILMIAAKQDPILPFEMLQEQMQHRAVQGAVLEEGHMSHLEEPKALAVALKSFLRDRL